MIIFWFSEIKWNYLRTRKQQILSRFHKDNFILFIEPISRIINNKFTLQDNKPIYNITIPQLRSVANPFILYIINLKLIRKCIFLFSTIWFFVFQFLLKKKPDVIITSNVFWIDTIKLLLMNKYKIYFTISIIGFGRAISEYGAAVIVGGSIDHVTRNITATIAQETSKGNIYLALQLGVVLITISFVISFISQINNKN